MLLLTDLMFPNKYAKWRLVEIVTLIEHFDLDILVLLRPIYSANVKYDFDFKELEFSHHLRLYDIWIFNPEYNYLQEYNQDFDGTQFNGKYPGCYLLRKKCRRLGPVDPDMLINQYSKVYHIFLMNYNMFNDVYEYIGQQYIHLYPGGGMLNNQSVCNVNPKTTIITSQQYLADMCTGKVHVVAGAPWMSEYEKVVAKTLKTGALNVCFTSLGFGLEKGSHIYQEIIKLYKETYPDSSVVFHNVGVEKFENCTYHPLMSQKYLDIFYHAMVDIIINCDTGLVFNGFPLGGEAMIQGCVMITPDHYGSNKGNKYGFTEELIIEHRPMEIITKIRQLDLDRELLLTYSKTSQERSVKLFGFDHMKAIMKIIDE